jgi:adenylate cyclase
MGIEIERKFLLSGDAWRKKTPGVYIRQGYINSQPGRSVRVRTYDHQGFLTIKGQSKGITRLEFEYSVPFEDANLLLDLLCDRPLIEKIRYRVSHKGFIWEIDEFYGENSGLLVAEIELTNENQFFSKPSWIGKEVTGDARYFNSSLVFNPYSKWEDNIAGS